MAKKQKIVIVCGVVPVEVSGKISIDMAELAKESGVSEEELSDEDIQSAAIDKMSDSFIGMQVYSNDTVGISRFAPKIENRVVAEIVDVREAEWEEANIENF